jgi:hypothetical protein
VVDRWQENPLNQPSCDVTVASYTNAYRIEHGNIIADFDCGLRGALKQICVEARSEALVPDDLT